MRAFAEHWSRLRKRVVRGILRALFTEEALGLDKTSDTVRPPNDQSQVATDSRAEAAGAGRMRTSVSRAEQG